MATGSTKAASEGDGGAPSPEQQVRALYEQAESQTAKSLEELVQKPSFGRLMAMSAENAAAMSRIAADVADLVLRNLRIASRADIVRLARQLHRTEDKLERVLQEVETVRDALARERGEERARS
jgi:pantoate kinase